MPTPNPIIGVAYIRDKGEGFSESYGIDAASLTQAQTAFQSWCLYRANVLSRGGELHYARVSYRDTPNEALPCVAAALKSLSSPTATDQDEFCNDPGNGLRFRFSTNSGVSVTRIFRDVADELINDFAEWINFNPATVLGFGGNPPAPTAAESWTVAFHKLVAKTIGVCRHVKKITSGPNIGQYDLLTYDQVMSRGPGYRKTGVPFGQSPGRRSVGV
jgi:hypothetical protein